jgi:hypothetical protein
LGPISTSGGVFSDAIPIDWAGVQLCLKYYNIHAIVVGKGSLNVDLFPFLVILLDVMGGLLIFQTIRKR